MFKKIAIVKIIGGFGNQLFQYSFANKLKQTGIRVFVDTSEYKKNKETNITKRNLEIDPYFFNLKKVGKFLKFFVDICTSLRLNRRLNINNRQNVIFNLQNDENLDLNIKSYINKYEGYFQNIDLLRENIEFIKKSIIRYQKSDALNNFKKNKGSTALHIRRTDYIDMDEALSLEFYENALNFCRKNIENFNYSIFTDDKEFSENELFKDAKEVFVSYQEKNNTLNDFINMTAYENFIVGNSTFSLIASQIGKIDSSIILVAKPWFRNQKSPNLYHDSWITLKNI